MINPKCCDIPHASVLSRGFATIGSHNCDWKYEVYDSLQHNRGIPEVSGVFFLKLWKGECCQSIRSFECCKKKQTSLKWNFTCQNCCKNDAQNGIHKTKISQNLIAFWLWIPFLQRLAAGGTARGGRSSRRDFRDGSETTLEPTFGGRGRHPRWNWDGSTNEQWEKTWECLGFIRDYTTGSYPVVWGI